MAPTELLVQKVHKVPVVKTVHKDDQVSQVFQEHKVPRDDVVLPVNEVPEVQKVTSVPREKRVNHPLNSDHQVSTESQEHRVYKENEDVTVPTVSKDQEDHRDQEEKLEWLVHQASTITTNCESSSQKS